MRKRAKYVSGVSLAIGVVALSGSLSAQAATESDQQNELIKKTLESQMNGDEEVVSTDSSVSNQLLLKNEKQQKEANAEKEVTNYKQVTLKTAMYLYKPNKLTTPVATLRATSMSYAVKKVKNKEYYEILVGQQVYWIKERNLQEATVNSQKQPKKIVQSIQTAATYKIYSKPSKQATLLLKGTTKQKIQTIDAVKGFYVVDLGSKKGYIPFNQIQMSLKNKQKVQLVADSKIYELKKGKKHALGTLKRDMVVRITSSNASTVTFKSGKRVFIIDRSVVIPTNKKESFEKLGKANYPVKLVSKTTATLYSSDKKAVGKMLKGQSVDLIALKGNYGVIEYAGKNVYVKLKQFKHTNMVDPTKNISASRYSYYVRVINQLYPEFTTLEKIGESVEGRAIYALKVGTGKKEILMDAALHAREHMTTNVLMEMIDQYTVSYRSNTKFAGYDTRAVLNKTSIWFVPMMNPDGVTLVQSGLKAMQPKNQKIIKAYNKSSNYKRWKANGRGVDLNVNFDGVWSLIGNTPKSFMNYKGPSAFSEPESKALKGFVEKHKFKTYYSYHSSGQVLYWFNFQNKKNYARDLKLTRQVSNITGYSIMAPMGGRGSGSSADWFILSQKKPGLTIEIAPYAGFGPVAHKHWANVWAKNKSIGLFGASEANKR